LKRDPQIYSPRNKSTADGTSIALKNKRLLNLVGPCVSYRMEGESTERDSIGRGGIVGAQLNVEKGIATE